MSSHPDVESILNFPRSRVGEELAVIPEDQWFDRKSVRIKPRDLACDLVGFANAEGGVVVVGIWRGQVEGVDRQADQINALMQTSFDFTVPIVRTKPRLLPCVRSDGEADHLLVFEVSPSEVVHTNHKDEVYLRVGDETRRLTFAQRQELQFDRGQGNYETHIFEQASVELVDTELLERYCDGCNAPDGQRLLEARGLSQNGVLNVAGCLLFGTYPQQFLPEAYIRVLRYRGQERGSGERQQLIEDRRCEGPILHQIEQAQLAVQELAPTRRALGPSGRFENISLIPEGAWLEGIVNAAVHRSYSIAGDHIRVEIFDDRIEIASPGRFPGLVGLFEPQNAPRFARNPRIARVCADLSLGQELGEGIRRIYEEMRRYGLPDPIYQSTTASVRLILDGQPADLSLTESDRVILNALRQAHQLSTGEIAEALGVSSPTARRRLLNLKKAGKITWVGESERDPQARWQTTS